MLWFPQTKKKEEKAVCFECFALTLYFHSDYFSNLKLWDTLKNFGRVLGSPALPQLVASERTFTTCLSSDALAWKDTLSELRVFRSLKYSLFGE